jgi:energy-converting hydrogenase Eha subunit A
VPTPVVALTFLGILIVVLGLFVAGNLTVVVIGLLAICSAGVLEVFGRRGIG